MRRTDTKRLRSCKIIGRVKNQNFLLLNWGCWCLVVSVALCRMKHCPVEMSSLSIKTTGDWFIYSNSQWRSTWALVDSHCHSHRLVCNVTIVSFYGHSQDSIQKIRNDFELEKAADWMQALSHSRDRTRKNSVSCSVSCKLRHSLRAHSPLMFSFTHCCLFFCLFHSKHLLFLHSGRFSFQLFSPAVVTVQCSDRNNLCLYAEMKERLFYSSVDNARLLAPFPPSVGLDEQERREHKTECSC